MSRAACLCAGLCGLAAIALTAPAGGTQGLHALSAESAAADSCEIVHHAKRIVKRKRVRRHGKVRKRKVVRWRRWTTCEPVVLPPLEPTPPDRLLVRATDSTGPKFTLSRPDVTAGLVTVQLLNLGEDGHDLHLLEDGTSAPEYSIPEVAPGGGLGQDSFSLDAGTWTLWCGLPGHRAAGMEASLTVN